MSIFKSTLKPFVAAQLKAREKVIGQVNDKGIAGTGMRSEDFLRYTSGKNGWVRMISMVDYNSQKFNPKTGKFEDDGKYKDDQLAKKYILEGGTLYNNRLRKGVNAIDGVYGSNLDKISNDPKSKLTDRTFGIRPMPGITSVSVQNKLAYGSLREATINFYAWDKHQLEELEILFMRPGYSVFLDWGWSQYLDHNLNGSNESIQSYPDNIRIKNFDVTTPDVFSKNIPESDYYDAIDKTVEKTNGNYDAMLGYVKNFNWQLMSNGGYQCSSTIISRGEVLEGIKASANLKIIIGSPIPPVIDPSAEPKMPISFFEKIFLTLKGAINSSELTDLGNPIPKVDENNVKNENASTPPLKKTGEFYNQNISDINKVEDELKVLYNNIIQGLSEDTFLYKYYDNEEIILGKGYPVPDPIGAVLPSEGTADGSGIEYLNLNTLIAIIQRFLIPRNKDTHEPLIYLVVPYETPCLMSEDTVSIDPMTCLIKNQYATFIMDTQNGDDPNQVGFQPQIYNSFSFISGSYKVGNPRSLGTFPNEERIQIGKKAKIQNANKSVKEFEYNIVNIGEIGNVYVSIGKIIDIYRSLAGSENGVDVIDFLKTLLEDISFSLGGINDFKLYTDKNTIQIIDTKYLESGKDSLYNDKFSFNLIGLKSICRDVKINSRIFEEQSTMIGIGASAGGNINNLGDVYASSQVIFNKGLKDRIVRNMEYGSIQNQDKLKLVTDEDLYYYNIYNNIFALSNYLKKKVIGTDKVINGVNQGYNSISAPSENEITNAASLLKTVHFQLNGKDVDFKALIPFELEITLDGIGGFVTGQIFTINKDFLPKEYFNKNIGFAITGISHMLQNNDWVTIIKAQICLLENDRYTPNVDKDDLKKKLAELRIQIQTNSYIFYGMADYVMFLIMKIIANPKEKIYKTPFLSGTTELEKREGNNLEYFGKDRWEDAIKNLKEEPNSNLLFTDGGGGCLDYLKQWWEANKSNTKLPNFPTSSFEEFLIIKTPTETKPLIFTQTFIHEFDKWLLNYSKLNENLIVDTEGKEKFIPADDFFLFKIFGKDPQTVMQSYLESRKVDSNKVEGKADYSPKEDGYFLNLTSLYAHVITNVQQYVETYPNKYWSLLIQGNKAPTTSLEINIPIKVPTKFQLSSN